MVVISSGSDMMCCKECTATQWASEAPHLWDNRSRWSTWPWPGFPPHSIQRWWHRSSYQCTSSRTALWTGRSASYLETPSPRWDRCRQNDPYSKKNQQLPSRQQRSEPASRRQQPDWGRRSTFRLLMCLKTKGLLMFMALRILSFIALT